MKTLRHFSLRSMTPSHKEIEGRTPLGNFDVGRALDRIGAASEGRIVGDHRFKIVYESGEPSLDVCRIR